MMTVLSEKFLSFFGRVTHCVGLSMLLASCGIKSEISTTTVGASLAGVTVSKIRPIEAKPSDLLTIEGSNFSASKDLRARVSLEDGSTKDVPLKVIDRTKGTFVMPEGAGLGLKSVSIFQGGSKQVASLGIVANTAENQLPILITEQSAVCSDTQYIDRNGDQQTGTKDCSAQSVKSCAVDGDSNCLVDGNTYKAAAINNLSAGNIKFGVTIAGVSGNVTLPANCSTNGQQSCVAAGTFFAGAACAADGSNCFLPSYSVPGLQTKKAVDVSTIDNTKMLDTLTVSGITGNVASRGSWNLTTAFPGEGFFTGVSNSPAASNYTGTLLGVAGTATLESHSNCTSNGQQSCVAAGTYFAGIACSANSSACYLPTYVATTQPLKAMSYDTINSSAASIRFGTTLGGVAGTLADCSSNAATGCVTTDTYQSANLTNLSAGNIKSGITIAGQLGDYPSVTYKLPRAEGATADLADLDNATFDAKVKSQTAFEYWTSAGSYQTGAGDADIAVGGL